MVDADYYPIPTCASLLYRSAREPFNPGVFTSRERVLNLSHKIIRDLTHATRNPIENKGRRNTLLH